MLNYIFEIGKLGAVACFNTLLNLFLFGIFIFVFDNSYLSAVYLVSSTIVTINAYYLTKKIVFRKTNGRFLQFFIFELTLIAFTIFNFEMLNSIFDMGAFASIAVIFSLRFILSFLFYKFLIFK